jgi:pyruvate-formate lyase
MQMQATARTMDERLAERLDRLRMRKILQTQEKQQVIGAMDYDDWALVLPPETDRDVVRIMGPSGVPITDVKLRCYTPDSNHPSGGFFGPELTGWNFRKLLQAHPVYVDADSSLAGAYMTNFGSYRSPAWNPDLSFDHLAPDHERYRLYHGIGGGQHFCQDMTIGYSLGWRGLLAKIRRYRDEAPDADPGFHNGLEQVVLGIQDWIRRHAAEADRLAAAESDPAATENLRETARINRCLVDEPPGTFREACQWTLWFQLCARMYNGSGSLGSIDELLLPFYERDVAAGRLTDEEAVFHLACYLVRDTAYIQLGGYDEQGCDTTNRVSFLVLEAARRLRVPANIGVCVGRGIDPKLLSAGVALMLETRTGIPKFLGIDRTAEGFERFGYPIELGRRRVYSGCHWMAIPGREYTMNDMIKVNFVPVLMAALSELLQGEREEPSVDALWRLFIEHLRRAVLAIARGIDFHLEHQHRVFPELMLDLLCHGPIEKGRDATDGGVEFCNIGVDGAGLAVAADSLAAIEARVAVEKHISWVSLCRHLESNWQGPDGEKARAMMSSVAKFGSGGSRADEYARRIARAYTDIVAGSPTPGGHRMLPGLFSWALSVAMGRDLPATPDGRRAGQPISHGPNPMPGFRSDSAATAAARAVADVQPGLGNTAPLQMDIDPGMLDPIRMQTILESLVKTHFDLGGTQINLNVINRERILEAQSDPSKYPDLIVRVTGFSAYFASLSQEMRRFVVERIVSEP